MLENENMTATERASRKNIIIIVAAVAVAVALIVALAIFMALLNRDDDKTEFPPIDPSLLEDTKEEDFDIMEYDGYLDLNRNVMLENKGNGMSLSIDDSSYENHGDGVKLVYKMLKALIVGDYKTYNSMVAGDAERYEWFSQQQIYDISLYERGREIKEGMNGEYVEYVIVLKYKIHENNGSYRNNIEPDAARPQYIVINDSTGRFMIMDKIDTLG